MRRIYIIGVVALGLMLTAARTSPIYGRFVLSARTFHHYFHDLKDADESFNPWQRFVFSLVLANGKTPPPDPAVQHHS
jgi:hypothetical protein